MLDSTYGHHAVLEFATVDIINFSENIKTESVASKI